MAFDFPAPPAANEIYTDTATGISYTWDGSVWRSGTTAAPPQTFVLRAGDTMTGALVLPHPPAAPLQSTTKKYVDETIAAQALYQGVWQVAANTPDLNVPPNAPLNGYSWLAQTVDPAVPEVAPATIPGIGGQTIGSTDTVKWNAGTLVYDLVRSASGVSAMTIADNPPASAFPGQAWWDSNNGKQYVYFDDGTSQQWVQMSGGGGGNITGPPDDAPTDGQLYGRQSATAGTTPAWAVVTGGGGGVPEAPIDTKQYARQDAAWTEVAAVAGGPVVVPVADAFPASPVQGQLHFLGTDASLYIWFVDASSVGSWVEVSAP